MFRRLLPLLIACLLVGLPVTTVRAVPAEQQSAQGYQGAVNTTANIRSGPGLEYPVVDQFQPGQVVTVVACNQDCSWLKLDTGNWIAGFLVDLVALPSPTENSTVVPSPAQPPSETQPANDPQPAETRRTQEIDPDKLELHEPSQAALDIVAQILSYTGLPQNFDLYSANIYNAAAMMVKGRRVILYDPQLIADLENIAHHDRPAVSVFAHEIGHHLAGHTLSEEYNMEYELEADYFSGFILQKMGATLDEAESVMSLLPDHPNMTNHPPQAERLVAIENGWQESARQDGLAAWQPAFPSFEEEVAHDSQVDPITGGTSALVNVLRRAQSQQLASKNAVLAYPVRDWSLGARALLATDWREKIELK